MSESKAHGSGHANLNVATELGQDVKRFPFRSVIASLGATLKINKLAASILMTVALAAVSMPLAAAPASAGTTTPLYAWGDNSEGQLGNGTTTSSDVPVPVSVLSNIKAIAAGSFHSLALLKNGTVVAWGDTVNQPVRVSGLSGVTAIAVGSYAPGSFSFSLALLSNGTVMAWGDNYYDELGDGISGGFSDVPVRVSGLTGVTAIAAGAAHGLALLKNGTVMAWGNNLWGQLGNGTTTSSDVPVRVRQLSGVSAIAAGYNFSNALLKNGTVTAWGDNEIGALGNGTFTSSDVPVLVIDLSNVKAVAADLVLLKNGTVMTWGDNSDVPGPVSGLSGVTALAAGAGHNLALLKNGTVMAWGDNSDGQLGNGTTTGSDVPVQVSQLYGVTAIAAGPWHSVALGGHSVTIHVVGVTYPNTGSGNEQVSITGSGFTPNGTFWLGVNPLESPLTYCGGPGQGGWCAVRVTATPEGTFSETITLVDVFSGCPPDIRVDATDLTTNVGSNEVTISPGYCNT